MDELVKRLRECTAEQNGEKTLWHQAADAIEELSARADAAEGMLAEQPPHWIPVTERLPEDLQNVLVIDEGRVTIGHCEHYYGEEEGDVEWHDILHYPAGPTHWMPLPEPPKEE